MFLAHSANSEGRAQPLVEHLKQVAELARSFAESFGAGDLAYLAGLLHDLGKFNPEWQEYIRDPEKRRGPPHSGAGALFVKGVLDLLCFPIAGHHGGLSDKAGLEERLVDEGKRPSSKKAFQEGLRALGDITLKAALPGFITSPTALDLFLRLLFSCLVDADFLDTEGHLNFQRGQKRGGAPGIKELWDRLEQKQKETSGKNNDAVNRIRHEVYLRCLEGAQQPPGIFRLTVPTGGGKTRSSMAFALCHALAYGLRRVIVAIPYTSIIEQNAQDYREILGEAAVLEHHSAVAYKDSEGENAKETWARLSSENWDAPIVVTTTVQLFESLFANRPSRCRKLHNIAGSVIILDEVQTLPPGLLSPMLDVLQDLAANYRVTVVLCSATMPAFEDEVKSYALKNVRDIVPDPARHFKDLARVRYELPEQGEKWSWQRVAGEMAGSDQSLAVLNTKKQALALLDALGDEDALHLSTLLCAAHRSDVLKEVKRRLNHGLPCRLVSTQVVEAGVDLDFPFVLRAMGPLDRIVQAAGRCNREGHMTEPGRVVVFDPEEAGMPRGAYRAGTDIAIGLIRGNPDMFSPELYRRYFSRLFPALELDVEKIQERRKVLDFPEVARRFRLIDENTVPVVVHHKPEEQRINTLLAAARRGDDPRRVLRQLQPFMVNIYDNQRSDMERKGLLVPVNTGLWEWQGSYDAVKGLGSTNAGIDPAALVSY